MDTTTQYAEAIGECKDIFLTKNRDYGTSWRILRLRSLTDQLYIKAMRIRSIDEKGTQQVEDEIHLDFVGIVNYSIMALIQSQFGGSEEVDIPADQLESLYDGIAGQARALMERKNHDYGEAWRMMRISSYTDLILMKLLRIKSIEDKEGQTELSEGVDANFYDIINYAIFALIRISENQTQK